MQREAEQRAGQTEGGLTREDLRRLNRDEWEADRVAADERRELRSDARRREQQRLDEQQPGESILDEVDPNDTAALGVMGLAPDEPPRLTGGMLDALKRPENLIRLAGMGLGLIGILLLLAGLRAEAQVAPGGGAPAVATATASPAGTPVTQASPPVTGTATANASFTKVSGPCNLAARFNDRYQFAATDGVLVLTQLSNGHASRGTIAPSGEFTTMAEGQGYRGLITGTTATGQHTYTAQGCNEVYDFTMTFPTAFLGGPGSAGTADRPPVAGPIRAVQTGTTTIYTVENVSDPDGDELTYVWSSTTNPCGTYGGASTPTFSWDHPHPPCPSEPSHPGTITVVIHDGRFAITRTYTRGSIPGTGGVPLAGVGISTIAPSPTAAVPTTAAPTSTVASTAAPTTAGTTSGPSIPLILLGGLLTLGGLGLVVRGPAIVGATPAERDEEKDPCDEEKRAEAGARARRDRARQRRDRIDDLRSRHERAQAENERAQREEAASKDDRNVSWGEDAEVGPSSRIYTNPDQKARIDRAEAAARAAREAADAARSAYEAAGNGGEAAAAQEELAAAESDWQAADAALRRCLQLNAPPPPPPPPPPTPPPPTPPTSAPAGPTTAGPTGPTTTRPRPTGPTQVRECEPGTERRRPGGTATTESVWIPDLRGAQLKFDSDMRAVTDFPIDDFIDWASFTKDAFFEGKKIVSLSGGLGPDAEIPVEGALDLVGFPDLLTYYDKMIDMALKALKEAAEQQALIAKNGDYWLEYRSERYELRCEPWQRCVNGRWVDFGKGSFTATGEMSDTRETRKIQVTADPSAIERAVRDAIDRSFRQVEAAKSSAEAQARRFRERCG